MSKTEDLLHTAICQAVASLNQGDEPRIAHTILRQSLVDYADAASSPPSSSAEIARKTAKQIAYAIDIFEVPEWSAEMVEQVAAIIESELATAPVVVGDQTLLESAEDMLKACAISMCAGCAAQLTLGDDGWHYPGQTETEQGYEKQQCQVPMVRKLIAQIEVATPTETGRETLQREFFCHWLVRVYEAGHRDTSYQEGETLAEALRQINQVLGFAGYEPESRERAELLTRKYAWNELEQP